MLDASVPMDIAMRSRGTPRVVNRLVRRLLDAAAEAEVSVVDRDLAASTFEILGIDSEAWMAMTAAISIAFVTASMAAQSS